MKSFMSISLGALLLLGISAAGAQSALGADQHGAVKTHHHKHHKHHRHNKGHQRHVPHSASLSKESY